MHPLGASNIDSGEDVDELARRNYSAIAETLTRNHQQLLCALALQYSPELSQEAAQKNFWTNGRFFVSEAIVSAVNTDGLQMLVKCKESRFLAGFIETSKQIYVPFPAAQMRALEPGTTIKRALCSLAYKSGFVRQTGALYALPIGESVQLPKNMRLNNVPHSDFVRQFYFKSITNALLRALQDDSFNKERLSIECTIPEMNPELDTYRIGTILELVREMTLTLAYSGVRVRICVQGPLGEGFQLGMPLALSGVRAIMSRMDWNEPQVEEASQKDNKEKEVLWTSSGQTIQVSESDVAYKQTVVGNVQTTAPDDTRRKVLGTMIKFGAVGPDQIQADDQVIIVIAPQNLIGASVIELLQQMVEAARGRPVIIINPRLQDRPSSGGVMQVRGRKERMEFTSSFKEIYSCRLLQSGSSMYAIRGMLLKEAHDAPWVVYSLDRTETGGNVMNEEYRPLAVFNPEKKPEKEDIAFVFKGI